MHSAMNLEGRIFRPVKTDVHGEASSDTVFHYHQRGELVWATYEGGDVAFGTLVGHFDDTGTLSVRYQHINHNREMRAGVCTTRIEVLPDGRCRLHESWQWTRCEAIGNTGSSIVEEQIAGERSIVSGERSKAMDTTDALDQLRYPIGRFSTGGVPRDREERFDLIGQLEAAPDTLKALLAGLSDLQLSTPYRPGGWTIRQVVHHLPDSHMNAYIRMKLAVTENTPVIRPYDEAAWAELPEARSGDPNMSLALLAALHRRWAAFLRGLRDEAYQRAYVHPVSGPTSLEVALASYVWHCRHHAAHIKNAIAASVTGPTRA